MGAASSASVFAGTTNLAAGYAAYSSSSAQGNYAQNQAETNARLVEKQAADTIKRGFKEASRYKQKIKQAQASQKVALAAQGIEISGDSALQILQETGAVGEVDAMTIRNNAYREAYGLKSQAIEYRAQGAFDRAAAKSNAWGSLITSGLKAAGNFYNAYGGGNSSSSSNGGINESSSSWNASNYTLGNNYNLGGR